jgi:hypothetical protein
MHFSQKALLYNRAEFEFGEKSLETQVDDGRLKVSFSVPYHEIGTKRSIKSFPEKAVPRFGYALLLGAMAGFVLTGGNPHGISNTLYVACVAIGAILIIGRRYARFDATRVPLASGNTILVFHDGQHHAILGEITRRRKTEMLRLYGDADPLNHPQLELKKFLWLKEEGIITESEFEEARDKIAAFAKAPSGIY